MSDANKNYWAQIHTSYATQDWIHKPTIFAEEILQYLPKGGTLLELGAGQGQDSCFFARHGFMVTATDLSHDSLQKAQENADRKHVSITLRELNTGEPLPFPDHSFDVVYSHLALHYFSTEHTKKIFAEIHRVLKPDGICATLLNSVDDSETSRTDFVQIEKDFYTTPAGIQKHFFSVASFTPIVSAHFETIILDNAGRTYKDDIQTLIRFVGKAKTLV